MGKTENLNQNELARLVARVAKLERQAPIGFSSITKGRLRVAGEGLWVEGIASTTGRQTISGRLDGTGTFDWSGPMWMRGAVVGNGSFTFNGPCQFNGNTAGQGTLTWYGAASFDGDTKITRSLEVSGDARVTKSLDVTGATRLRARTTLENDLVIQAPGKISLGTMTLERLGGGGTINFSPSGSISASLGQITLVPPDLSAGLEIGSGRVRVAGALAVTGAKQFVMDHPTDRMSELYHAATESPVSGVEYWGESGLDETGSTVVQLPTYFKDLTKPYGRAVLVTARGFIADWGDIEGNTFTVTGKPGGRFSWLVKAERLGADFAPVQQKGGAS
ncbi:hypothetical protein [Mycetocola saprophilus]|uniref:hypothetical protein n=1 Tax=Mycetocola saprophilus TaxID=76636 RepID=UPI0012DF9C53|nr:hypothetical protein [Mycetocola saprophilus]